MKPITEWTDQEISDKVNEHWKIAFATDGKGLTEEMKDLDRAIKKEYWRREEVGLHEIQCMICTNADVKFYDIMKHFCSDMTKIAKNICEKHIEVFETKKQEFLNKQPDPQQESNSNNVEV